VSWALDAVRLGAKPKHPLSYMTSLAEAVTPYDQVVNSAKNLRLT